LLDFGVCLDTYSVVVFNRKEEEGEWSPEIGIFDAIFEKQYGVRVFGQLDQ
jgi:hypothetical protein